MTEPGRVPELPDYVARPASGAYRGLNPTTKLVIAFAEALFAFTVRGWTGPLVVIAVLLACAVWARIGRAFVPYVLATIPLVISILLVNTLLFPGATDVIARLGPLRPTWSGLTAALQATLRVVAFAMSVALFALTTTTDQLVSDLERRGLGRRPAFVVSAAIGTIPGILQRAREITNSQRARGLDTQGRIWRRVRGILPLAGPLVVGALTDVEERTMALEARAFSAPGRRTVLRVAPDSPRQRLVRWVLFVGTIATIVGVVVGALAWLP